MALPKNQWAKKEPAPPILPSHWADFSNLEELLQIVGGPDEFLIIPGESTGDIHSPHITIASRARNKPSYQFIKTSDPDIYTLRVLGLSDPAQKAPDLHNES